MSLLSRFKVWSKNELLTAADLNAEFNNILNNLTASIIEGGSSDVTQMRVTQDPGEVGTEVLAASMLEEIRQLRRVLVEITGNTYWYESPVSSLVGFLNGAGEVDTLADGVVTASKLAALSVATGNLQDLAVTEGKLAALSVSNGKIQDLAVTGAKIADNTINGAQKLQDNTVGLSKLTVNPSAGSLSPLLTSTASTTFVTVFSIPINLPVTTRRFVCTLNASEFIVNTTSAAAFGEIRMGLPGQSFTYKFAPQGVAGLNSFPMNLVFSEFPISAGTTNFFVEMRTSNGAAPVQLTGTVKADVYQV